MTTTKVYSPRGTRGGGGLVAQVTIPQEDIDLWVTPSALARLDVGRRLDRALRALQQAVLRAFEEEERRRRVEAGSATGVRDDLSAEAAVRRAEQHFDPSAPGSTTPAPTHPGDSSENEGSTST